MTFEEQIEWTDDEKRILRNQVLITEANRIRNSSKSETKPPWQRVLESTGGTALITVLIGGIFGTIISSIIQSNSKEREFQQTWLKARGDQAMVGYKDFLEKQQETVKKLFERIGNIMSASEDYITLTSPELTPLNIDLSPEEKKGIEKQRTSIKERFNSSNRDWRNEREILGMLVNYYFPNKSETQTQTSTSDTNVTAAWQQVKESVNQYTHCAERWVQKSFPRETDMACQKEKNSVANNLVNLNKNFEINRKYAWEGWESPEKLKDILEQSNK